MKYFSKAKCMFGLALFVFILAVTGMPAEAKTVTKKNEATKKVYSVGEKIYVTGVTGLKINGKSYTKSKKKIQTVTTYTDPDGFKYRTGSYFYDRDAYKTYAQYKNAIYGEKTLKFVASNGYNLTFLKKGTYTISWLAYSMEDVDKYGSGRDSNGNAYLLFAVNGEKSTERFYLFETGSKENYYKSKSGKIYAYSVHEGKYVEASLKKDYKGVERVYYSRRNVVKTEYKQKIKVLGTDRVVSSVTLGKSKISGAERSADKSAGRHISKKFLSGSRGKLTVKMADKNYGIKSIIVETYDKDGKPVYTKVSNKNNITYGVNNYNPAYNPGHPGYSYEYGNLYKPTTVYVSYNNKYTGAYTKWDIVKDADGEYQIVSTYRYDDDKEDRKVTSWSPRGSCYQSYTFYKK